MADKQLQDFIYGQVLDRVLFGPGPRSIVMRAISAYERMYPDDANRVEMLRALEQFQAD